jgi:methionine aminopeptidase
MNKLSEIREAVANYMQSEGCSCCEDREAHKIHEERLAKLLNVPKYDDGSGYNFDKYRSKEEKTNG